MAIAASERAPPLGANAFEQAASGSLAGLLFEAAETRPGEAAFRDGGARAEWCDRPPLELSNAIAAEAVRRLADFFVSLQLEPGASVGIWLPNGSETALSVLAVGEAGLTACLLDVTCTAGELSKAIEAGQVRALVTQTRLGTDWLAHKARIVAAGFPHLLFLMAFGPNVPEGVLDLDPILLAPRSAGRLGRDRAFAVSPGVITLSWQAGRAVPIHRSYQALIAATGLLVGEARISPGDRMLTFLPPDDLKGLSTGLVSCLLTGATLECHSVFSGEALLRSLASPEPTHLVVPGFMEGAIAEAGLPGALASCILVHNPPTSFGSRPWPSERTIDVLSLGEMGCLALKRSRPDMVASPLDPDRTCGLPMLFEAKVNGGHTICIRGAGAAAQDGAALPAERWRPSGFEIDVSSGAVTGVSAVNVEPSW